MSYIWEGPWNRWVLSVIGCWDHRPKYNGVSRDKTLQSCLKLKLLCADTSEIQYVFPTELMHTATDINWRWEYVLQQEGGNLVLYDQQESHIFQLNNVLDTTKRWIRLQ
jgi:hypothetical protein